MKRIKIVQIGMGHDHAVGTLVAMKYRSELFDLAGVVIPEGEEKYAEQNAAYLHDVKELTLEDVFSIPDLDAVVVESEETSLTHYAKLAADRGLHIHMDKPGSASPEDFARLSKAAKEKRLVFHLGYMYRYNPAVRKLMADIREGKLGEIYCVEAHMSCMHKTAKRQWLDRFPGGMMFFLGCHLVDLILQIQGLPDEILPLNTGTGIESTTSQDYGMAVFRYKNGLSFVKTCAAEVCGYVRRQLVVCGSKGTVEFKPLEYYAPEDKGYQLGLYTGIAEVYVEDTVGNGWQDCRKISKTDTYDRYDDMIQDFAAMVRGEKENPISYEYEVLLHRVLLAACGEDISYKDPIVL